MCLFSFNNFFEILIELLSTNKFSKITAKVSKDKFAFYIINSFLIVLSLPFSIKLICK